MGWTHYIKNKLAILTLTTLSVFIAVSFAGTATAQYQSDSYGECAYGRSCPAPESPDPDPDPTTPPVTDPEPDPEPSVTPDETNSVNQDIDGDGNEETAIDTDGNTDNGYEEFYDEDGSSNSVVEVKDSDGNPAYLIDTDGDDEADTYWEPSTGYVSEINKDEEDGNYVYTYTDSVGDDRTYVIGPIDEQDDEDEPIFTNTATSDEDGESNGNSFLASLENIVKEIPAPIAYSFPYFLLLIIGLLIARLLLQARKELQRLHVIEETINHEKQLAFEKKNFLMLASHYLRTPVTILTGNIELMQSQKQLDDAKAKSLKLNVKNILDESNDILSKVENDATLKGIEAHANVKTGTLHNVTSPLVIGPIIFILALISLAHILFISFDVTQLNYVDMIVQILLAILLVQVFISTFRRRSINSQNRADKERVLEEQRNLDDARQKVVAEAASRLSTHVESTGTQIEAISNEGVDTANLHAGYDRLADITSKFVFANQLSAQTVQVNREQINTKQTIETAIESQQPVIAEKNLTVQKPDYDYLIVQNPQMLGTVVSSLIDNAVRYSEENDSVIVSTDSNANQFTFSVKDTGPGLSSEQLSSLFKPFTRAESAETFNTEGLGFSLYLDKLIAHYLHGELKMESQPGQGTVARLEIPII